MMVKNASELTYKELQKELKERGAKASGKKVDLTKRLQDIFDAEESKEENDNVDKEAEEEGGNDDATALEDAEVERTGVPATKETEMEEMANKGPNQEKKTEDVTGDDGIDESTRLEEEREAEIVRDAIRKIDAESGNGDSENDAEKDLSPFANSGTAAAEADDAMEEEGNEAEGGSSERIVTLTHGKSADTKKKKKKKKKRKRARNQKTRSLSIEKRSLSTEKEPHSAEKG
eukprot:g782.t1